MPGSPPASDPSSEEHSRQGGPSSGSGSAGPPADAGEPSEGRLGRPEDGPSRSFLGGLLHRRVPQVLAGYLGVTWTLFELMRWLSEQYLISPHLGQAILFGLLLLLPSVLGATYRHGRPGPDQWTRAELWGIAANLVVAVLILAFAFAGAELGSMTRTVQTTAAQTTAADTAAEEAGGEVVRQVPKKQFRRHVALFYFSEAEKARADTALLRAASTALRVDLRQDAFVRTFSPVQSEEKRQRRGYAGELRRHGYGEGLGVPLGLKREVALKAGAGHVLSGRVGRAESGRVLLKTELRETETGRLVAERRFEGEDLFGAVDRASAQLKRDLGLPEGHLESVTDLPVTQVFTASTAAAKHYAQGYHFLHFGSDPQRAARKFARATGADTTFALGHLRRGQSLWQLGKREQARQAFGSAGRHDYRLPETWAYWLKATRFYWFERRPEAALKICEQWTSLRPYDLKGWRLRATIQEKLMRYEQALASYRHILELAPESKSIERSVVRTLLRTGQFEKALQRAKSYGKAHPKDVDGPLLAGIIHWRLGQLGQAKRAFRRAGRIDAREARPYLAALSQARGQFEAALSKIKEASGAGSGLARSRLAHHHWLRGRIGRSRDVLDSLKTQGFGGFDLAVQACDHYGPPGGGRIIPRLIGRLETARQKDSPSTPSLQIASVAALARCNTATGKLEEAEKHLSRAMTILRRPGTPRSYRPLFDLDYLWGRLREAQGRHKDAAARYKRYIESSSPRSLLLRSLRLPHLRQALSYQKSGEPGKAKAAYQKALALHPAYPRLNYHYARFLAGRGRREAAREHLRRALDGWAPADPGFRPRQKAEALADSLGTGPA